MLLLFWMITGAANAQEMTTVVLVRHAEKGVDEGGDPQLTEEGMVRAQSLAELLNVQAIDVIYSTPFNRTRQTVQPMAEARNMEIVEYNPFDMNKILEMIRGARGKTMVISGHSNTVPLIINQLIGEDRYKMIDESDYGNLYILTIADEDVKVLHLRY